MKITGSPDTENGFTRIAHELLEVMALYPFTRSEYKVLLIIIRETYGWRVKRKRLSYTIIAKATGMSRRHVKRTIDKLTKDNVIFRQTDKTGSIFGLNKYYFKWRLWITLKIDAQNVHRLLSEVSTPLARNVHTSVDNTVHTLPSGERKERNIYKDSIKESKDFSKNSLFKSKKSNFRERLKEPVLIGEVIKQEFGEEVTR